MKDAVQYCSMCGASWVGAHTCVTTSGGTIPTTGTPRFQGVIDITDHTRLLADYRQACDLIAEQKKQIEELKARLSIDIHNLPKRTTTFALFDDRRDDDDGA